MRRGYILLTVLTLLSVIAAVCMIALMPDTVPMHYNEKGEIDRFGSRYENLILPGLCVLMGAFFFVLSRAREKRDARGARTLLIAGIITVLFFNILSGYFLWRCITYAPGAAETAFLTETGRVTAVLIGALLIALGGAMPKAPRGGAFGLRTVWSMKNDNVWRKSQFFGGVSSVVCGLIMLACALFLPHSLVLPSVFMLTLALAALGALASYILYRNDKRNE